MHTPALNKPVRCSPPGRGRLFNGVTLPPVEKKDMSSQLKNVYKKKKWHHQIKCCFPEVLNPLCLGVKEKSRHTCKKILALYFKLGLHLGIRLQSLCFRKLHIPAVFYAKRRFFVSTHIWLREVCEVIYCVIERLKLLTGPASLWFCWWNCPTVWVCLLDTAELAAGPRQKFTLSNPESLCGLLENLVHVTAVATSAQEGCKSPTGHLIKRQHAA